MPTPLEAILHLEAKYAADLRRARTDRSASSKIRVIREARAAGALEALGELRMRLLVDAPLDTPSFVSRLSGLQE